jgi:hypothetical protein
VAKGHAEDSIAMCKALGDEAGLVLVLPLMGDILRREGKTEDAVECCRKALQIARRVYGDGDTRVADAIHDCAAMHRMLGMAGNDASHYRQSLDLLAQEFAIRQRLLGSAHPLTQQVDLSMDRIIAEMMV